MGRGGDFPNMNSLLALQTVVKNGGGSALNELGGFCFYLSETNHQQLIKYYLITRTQLECAV